MSVSVVAGPRNHRDRHSRCGRVGLFFPTTNIYAEINLKMKAEAMALCDVAEPDPGRHWKKDKDLMAFLNSY